MGLVMTVVLLVGDALLLLLGVCGSALLSGHQWSPLPAGHGSQRSDLHLCEVQGHQVALPRLPVHSLRADWAAGDWRRELSIGIHWSDEIEGRGEMRGTRKGWEKWAGDNDRMTNTIKHQPRASFHVSTNLFWLLLHFADKHCGRDLQRQYYGWSLEQKISTGIFFSIRLP